MPPKRPDPTRPRRGLALAVTILGSTGLAVSSEAEACPALVPDDRAALSISLGDGSASDFMIDVFERRDEEGDLLGRDCYANVVIPLSAFPSASNRLDTGAIARSMQIFRALRIWVAGSVIARSSRESQRASIKRVSCT